MFLLCLQLQSYFYSFHEYLLLWFVLNIHTTYHHVTTTHINPSIRTKNLLFTQHHQYSCFVTAQCCTCLHLSLFFSTIILWEIVTLSNYNIFCWLCCILCKDGSTPLIKAVGGNCVEVVEFLLKAGADIRLFKFLSRVINVKDRVSTLCRSHCDNNSCPNLGLWSLLFGFTYFYLVWFVTNYFCVNPFGLLERMHCFDCGFMSMGQRCNCSIVAQLWSQRQWSSRFSELFCFYFCGVLMFVCEGILCIDVCL